jgi:hypothetical protein
VSFNKNIPLNVTGPSYQDRSRPLSSQQTKNFYHAIVEEGKENYVLHSWHGLKKLSTLQGIDRGMSKDRNYCVKGTKLYSFTKLGVTTEIGDIPGVKRAVIAWDGVNLIIVVEKVWIYSTSTGLIVEATNSNIVGATAATFINNQIVYTVNGLFVVSTPGDPTTASGLNAAAAESQPDDLVRAYAFQQALYLFGANSTEPWWNSGTGNPPFQRIDGQIFEVGCAAIHSIANTDEAIYWLGDDHAVYQASGGSKKRISTSAISHAIAGYSVVDDAIAYTLTLEGMNFYILTFITENKTWALNESLGKDGWFELSSGVDNEKYQATSIAHYFGKNYAIDDNSVFEIDINTFTNGSDSIQRRRITSSVNGKLLNAPGARVQMSRLEIIMEKGVGLITGQGEDPQIMIDISRDGGKSWAQEGFVRVGRLGETQLRVELFSLISDYDFIFRITTSDPVSYEIYSAVIDLRLAGR